MASSCAHDAALRGSGLDNPNRVLFGLVQSAAAAVARGARLLSSGATGGLSLAPLASVSAMGPAHLPSVSRRHLHHRDGTIPILPCY